MIINSYAVLDLFVAGLRLLLALAIVAWGVSTLWHGRGQLEHEKRKELEDRSYLLFLMAMVLLVLNLASWPLLYLLLQSYVPEWPTAMCIYGVTQIGTGSLGPSRYLPGLLKFLEAAKPSLVFGSGAWFVLYLINRRTQTAPLMRRILVWLVAVGLLAAADAAAESAYLLIPKKEDLPSVGCCMLYFDERSEDSFFSGKEVTSIRDRPGLSAAFYSANLAMAFASAGLVLALRRRSMPPLAPIVLGAVVNLAIAGVFLVEVASPILLNQPWHHCPYDLIPQVPQAIPAVALFLGGTFCVGWAGVARWWGACPESAAELPSTLASILLMALFCYAGAVGMLSLELALAG